MINCEVNLTEVAALHSKKLVLGSTSKIEAAISTQFFKLPAFPVIKHNILHPEQVRIGL